MRNPTSIETSVTLVLGGARSGKSAFAEALVTDSGRRPVYVATGSALDAEMVERIANHRAARGELWRTIEETTDIAEVLEREANADVAILVDCLTLWLTNLFFADENIDAETQKLCAVLAKARGPIVFVSNEVGQGIVPDNALARRFRDEQGRLNRRIAEVATQVVLVAAGLPLLLKPNPTQAEISL